MDRKRASHRETAPPGPAEPPPYEPPAIAWEEPFEPVAATSCAFTNPFDQNCAVRPQV